MANQWPSIYINNTKRLELEEKIGFNYLRRCNETNAVSRLFVVPGNKDQA